VLRPPDILLLLVCLGAAFVAGAASAAEPRSGYFQVSVRGEVVRQWSYVEYNPDTECAVRRSYAGRETSTFRSRRPTRILIRTRADGRLVLGALLRSLSGTHVESGTRSERSTAEDCPTPVAYMTRCAPRRAGSPAGTVALTAPRRGIVQLKNLRLPVRLPRAPTACRPRAVVRLPMRVTLARARAHASDVFDPRARAVELEAQATETTTFSGGDSGRAMVTTRWTLTFDPVAA
jgi:hypothetical protein